MKVNEITRKLNDLQRQFNGNIESYLFSKSPRFLDDALNSGASYEQTLNYAKANCTKSKIIQTNMNYYDLIHRSMKDAINQYHNERNAK